MPIPPSAQRALRPSALTFARASSFVALLGVSASRACPAGFPAPQPALCAQPRAPLPSHITAMRAFASAAGATLVKDKFELPILTPALQSRRTAKLVLPNQMKVYVISDPLASMSGAALSVETGSWRDSRDGQEGLAHFLEVGSRIGRLLLCVR